MNYYFVDAASKEFEEAKEWYDGQLNGLVLRFHECVENCVVQILKHPRFNTEIDENIYRANIKVFPYNLIYTIQGNDIWIVAIAHKHRRPFYWKDRA